MKFLLALWLSLSSTLLFSLPTQERPIDIFFTKNHRIDQEILKIVFSTKKSFKAALYDINFPKFVDALKVLKNNGISVQIVCDADAKKRSSVKALQTAGIPIVFDKKKFLMHHKFMVIDSNVIWTGSTNFTHTDLFFNRNNSIALYNPALAKIYENEFDLMFQKDDFQNQTPASKSFFIGKLEVQAYFPPRNTNTEKLLLKEIQSAKKSIKVAAFALTHTKLIQLLENKIAEGIKVQILLDRTQAKNKRSIHQRMFSESIKIYQGKGKLHHKFIIIDEETVLTGSFNFTKAAASKNNENLLVLKNQNLAKIYLNEFKKCESTKK